MALAPEACFASLCAAVRDAGGLFGRMLAFSVAVQPGHLQQLSHCSALRCRPHLRFRRLLRPSLCWRKHCRCSRPPRPGARSRHPVLASACAAQPHSVAQATGPACAGAHARRTRSSSSETNRLMHAYRLHAASAGRCTCLPQVALWDRRVSQRPRSCIVAPRSAGDLACVQVSGDGQLLYAGGDGSRVVCWDLRGGRLQAFGAPTMARAVLLPAPAIVCAAPPLTCCGAALLSA